MPSPNSPTQTVCGKSADGVFRPEGTTDPILDALERYHAAGLALCINGADKRPHYLEWNAPEVCLDLTRLRQEYSPGMMLGIVCGHGGVECIDADSLPHTKLFSARVRKQMPDLYERSVRQRTQSSCGHLIYRVPDHEIPGSQKLAFARKVVPGEGRYVLTKQGEAIPAPEGASHAQQAKQDGETWYADFCVLETRGRKGQFVCDPSPGWAVLNGDLTQIPAITWEEREQLFEIARSFDETGKTAAADRPESEWVDDPLNNRPGDIFNRETGAEEVIALLKKHGWTIDRRDGENCHLRRPGKDEGSSATVRWRDGMFYCFSSSVSEFDTEQGYPPFSVFARLEFDGDHSSAAKALLQKEGQTEAPSSNPKLADAIKNSIKSVQDFKACSPPPRKHLISPWLTEKSLGMLYAETGRGKTAFATGVVEALTSGEPFGPWRVHSPAQCLYLDAELPHDDLVDRFANVLARSDLKARLDIYSSDFAASLGHPVPNLDDAAWRDAFLAVLKELGTEMLFLDNISSLTGGDENSKEAWSAINKWLLSLRFAGISVQLLHHEGKSGSQRGSSHRVDNLDYAIRLTKPTGYQETDGCRFEVRFEKKRIKQRHLHLIRPVEFQLVENEDGTTCWSTNDTQRDGILLVLAGLQHGMKQAEIARELDVSPSTVSRHKQAAVKKGYVDDKGHVTEAGKSILEFVA